jgi:hypothetical protein
MQPISQTDLARELDLSPMHVSRVMRALNRAALPLNDFDCLKGLTVAELKSIGFGTDAAIEFVLEQEAELRYVTMNPKNRAWVMFVETEERAFRLTALTRRHLEVLADHFPLSPIIPLHRLAASAQDRLEALQIGKARVAA